jgi:hypothetical protein
MHKKTSLKIIPIFVSLLFFTVLLSSVVMGDGCALRHIPNIDRWEALSQEKQIAVINYKDGYEKLILVINVKNSSLQGDKAVWIFPVPSDPKNVNIDILDDVPRLDGTNIKNLAGDAVNDPYSFMYFSQPYTIPLGLFLYVYVGGMIAGSASPEYTVYEHMEKKGFTTEKVGANNSKAFQAYLNSNNLALPEGTNATIDEYIGQNYCFIVSWISDVEEFRKESLLSLGKNYELVNGYVRFKPTNSLVGELSLTLGVSINFPTEKIYYPLKLTSVYGSETIPMFIQVIDYVTLAKYPDISQDGFINTNYYIDKEYQVPTNLTTFFSKQIQQNGVKDIYTGRYNIQNLRYTEIEIHSKAQYLTEDLFIDDSVSVGTSFLDFVASNGWIILLSIFILSSCLSSILAGIIIYGKQKPIFYKFALLGLSNFASLIGFFIASFALKIDQKFVRIPKEKKTIEKEKTNSLSPITWIGIAIGIVLLFLSPFLTNTYYLGAILFLFLLLFAPVIVLISIFIFYGVRKDKQKTFFNILFSVFFMVFLFLIQITLQATL